MSTTLCVITPTRRPGVLAAADRAWLAASRQWREAPVAQLGALALAACAAGLVMILGAPPAIA